MKALWTLLLVTAMAVPALAAAEQEAAKRAAPVAVEAPAEAAPVAVAQPAAGFDDETKAKLVKGCEANMPPRGLKGETLTAEQLAKTCACLFDDAQKDNPGIFTATDWPLIADVVAAKPGTDFDETRFDGMDPQRVKAIKMYPALYPVGLTKAPVQDCIAGKTENN